ncbi:hypothetical protein ACFOEE_19660 [Pseudoalteromonas fenneropenaei]|uniref:ABC transporter permease n=1 Tax=Pseudoalteromonas fenneropenaei TaxID=1737459 RepID=A0ABV7CQA2_9GAMM
MRSFFKRTWIDYRLQLARKNSLGLLILLLLLSLGFYPLPEDGYVTFRVSGIIGAYNSVWMAIIYSMMTSMLVALFGFYFIKGAISLDRKRNLGVLLAHTSMSNTEYILQKTLASWMVLTTLCGTTLLTTMLLNVFVYDQYSFELGIYIKLFVVVLLPSLFVCAAFASLFDSHPRLASSLGNVVYFFLFAGILSSLGGSQPGFVEISAQINEAILAAYPNTTGSGVSIGVLVDSPENLKALGSILIKDLSFNSGLLSESALVLLFGFAVFALAVVVFDRFKHVPKKSIKKDNRTLVSARLFDRLRALYPNSPLVRLFITELSLLTRAIPKFLWLAMLILNLSIVALLQNDTAKLLMGLLCLLNLNMLGKLGIREDKAQLGLLLNHCTVSETHRRYTQIMTAVLIMIGTQLGSVVWVWVQYGLLNAISLIIGCTVWVLLSFVIGPWFKQRHPFDLVFLIIWYLGPMNGFEAMDFLAIHQEISIYGIGLLCCMVALLYSIILTRPLTSRAH